MKAIIFILLFSILLSSCSHRIIRSGYKVNKSDYRNCEITIKKFTEIPDSVATNIGEIKLGESGFAMACSEEHAL